jgi:hypothetical protein
MKIIYVLICIKTGKTMVDNIENPFPAIREALKNLDSKEPFLRLRAAETLLSNSKDHFLKRRALQVVQAQLDDTESPHAAKMLLNQTMVDHSYKMRSFQILVNSLPESTAETALIENKYTIINLLHHQTPTKLGWPKRFLDKVVACLDHPHHTIREVAISALALYVEEKPKNLCGRWQERIFQSSGMIIGEPTARLALARIALKDDNWDDSWYAGFKVINAFTPNAHQEFSQWVLRQKLHSNKYIIREISIRALAPHAKEPTVHKAFSQLLRPEIANPAARVIHPLWSVLLKKNNINPSLSWETHHLRVATELIGGGADIPEAYQIMAEGLHSGSCSKLHIAKELAKTANPVRALQAMTGKTTDNLNTLEQALWNSLSETGVSNHVIAARQWFLVKTLPSIDEKLLEAIEALLERNDTYIVQQYLDAALKRNSGKPYKEWDPLPLLSPDWKPPAKPLYVRVDDIAWDNEQRVLASSDPDFYASIQTKSNTPKRMAEIGSPEGPLERADGDPRWDNTR